MQGGNLVAQPVGAPTVGCVSGDHFEGIHHFISNTLFQKNARSCRFFVGRDAPKNMETMTTRSPKRARGKFTQGWADFARKGGKLI